MEYMTGWLRVRVPLELRATLDEVASKEGLSTSLWVRRVLVDALDARDVSEVVAWVDADHAVKVAATEAPPAPAAVQATPDMTEQQKAAEAAHWEKVARMQKIKGA